MQVVTQNTHLHASRISQTILCQEGAIVLASKQQQLLIHSNCSMAVTGCDRLWGAWLPNSRRVPAGQQ